MKEKDGFRRQLEFTEFDLMIRGECSITSKIGKTIVTKKILEEYYVKIYKIDVDFYKNRKEKIKADKNGHAYISFKTHVNFSEYNLAVEIDEKRLTASDLVFNNKRQEAIEKKSTVNLLELIQIKRVMTYFMKLVECKYLLVILRTKD